MPAFARFLAVFRTFFPVILVLFEQIVLKFEKIKCLKIKYIEKWFSPELFFGLTKTAFGLTFGQTLNR